MRTAPAKRRERYGDTGADGRADDQSNCPAVRAKDVARGRESQ